MKGFRSIARNSGCAEGSQQFPIAIEFKNVVTLAPAHVSVGDPDVVGVIDEESVRKQQRPRTECLHENAICVEFHDRIQRAVRAAVGATAFGDPDMSLVVDRHCGGSSHVAAGWQLEETIDAPIWIGHAADRVSGASICSTCAAAAVAPPSAPATSRPTSAAAAGVVLIMGG